MKSSIQRLLVLTLLLAACGDDEPSDPSGDAAVSGGGKGTGSGFGKDAGSVVGADAGAATGADAGGRTDDAGRQVDGGTSSDGGQPPLPSDTLTPGPAAPASSGVTPTKQLQDITDPEAGLLCVWESATYKAQLRSRKAYCLSELPGDAPCAEELDTCLRSDDPEYALTEDWRCERARADDYLTNTPCTLTVGEYETCMKAVDAADQAYFATASCPATGTLAYPTLPSACDVVLTKCPGLYE